MPDPLVNVPKISPETGEHLLSRVMDREAQRQQRKTVVNFFEAIQAAGSRERALDVVRNYSTEFRNEKDITTAFRAVDEFYPESSREVKQVTVYNAQGQPTTTFMSAQEAVGLTPEEVVRRFGEGASLTKPDMADFYSQPDEKGAVQVLGRFPVSQRPQGAVTLPELTAARQFRAEERADKRFALSEEKFRSWFDLAEKRWMESLKKLGGTAEDKDRTFARQILNDATRLTLTSLNGRVLADGSFFLGDDNRVDIWEKRLRYISNAMESNPELSPNLALKLANDAAKLYPLKSTDPLAPKEEPPKPAAEKPGGLSRAVDAVSRAVGLGGEKKPAAKPGEKKPAVEQTPAQQIKQRATEITGRADLTDDQKKAALAKLREIARKNNVKVDF
jgi:hypothetical protein